MSQYKKKIITDIAVYGIGRYINQFIGFFIAIFVRNFLGPLYMGIWSLVRVIMSYANYSELGALQAIFYKVPYHNGKGEAKESEKIQNVVFSFLVLMSFVASIVILLGAVILKEKMPHELFTGLVIFPLFFMTQRVWSYFIMVLKASKKFSTLGYAIIFDSAINLILVIFIVSKLGIYGMYVISIILPIMDVLFVRFAAKERYNIKFRLIWPSIIEYVKFGFPVFISAFSVVILYSMDSIMIAKMIGLVPLGYYSIAVMARTYSTEFSQNFASVLSPYFVEAYGSSGDTVMVGKKIIKYTELTSCIMAVILGLGYVVLPFFVQLVMPKFTEGISAMKIILICTFFSVISGHMKNFLVMKERQILLMVITFIAVFINVILNYIAITSGYGISGVAAASAVTTFLMFISIAYFSVKYLDDLSKPMFTLNVLLPFVYIASIVFFVERTVSFGGPYISLFIKSAILCLMSTVIIWHVNKHTGIIGILLEIIVERMPSNRSRFPLSRE